MTDETAKRRMPMRHHPAGAKPVGAFLPRVAKAVFEAHGFPSTAVLSDWPAIAGAGMASFTSPERLIWPRRTNKMAQEDQAAMAQSDSRRTGATLVLRVDGPRALEVQHDAPRIIERINTYFGYRAVAALRIIQGPVTRTRLAEKAARQDKTPDEQGLERIRDDRLRNALARLGMQLD